MTLRINSLLPALSSPKLQESQALKTEPGQPTTATDLYQTSERVRPMLTRAASTMTPALERALAGVLAQPGGLPPTWQNYPPGAEDALRLVPAWVEAINDEPSLVRGQPALCSLLRPEVIAKVIASYLAQPEDSNTEVAAKHPAFQPQDSNEPVYDVPFLLRAERVAKTDLQQLFASPRYVERVTEKVLYPESVREKLARSQDGVRLLQTYAPEAFAKLLEDDYLVVNHEALAAAALRVQPERAEILWDSINHQGIAENAALCRRLVACEHPGFLQFGTYAIVARARPLRSARLCHPATLGAWRQTVDPRRP